MIKTLRLKAPEVLWPPVLGAMLALGLLLPVLHAAALQGASAGVLACLLTAAAVAFVSLLGRKMRILGLALAAVVLGGLLMGSETLAKLPDLIRAFIDMVRGDGGAGLQAFGPQLAVIGGIALTLIGWAMAQQPSGFYPAMSLMMVALLIIWFSPRRDAVWLFAPALVALCALFARSAGEETPVLRTVIAAAIAVLLALGIFSPLSFESPRLETFAESLRNYITDTMFFTDPRSVYSISVDGFKPLSSRLGGPTQVEPYPVMTVETPTSLLLRGTLYNEYTGLNWYDRLATRRYNYADPRNRAVRVDTMDENRPQQALKVEHSALFREATIRVTMQTGSASTLFLPQRVSSLDMPMAMVPYFNLSGEAFITRDLAEGDSYTLTAPVLHGADTRLEQALAEAAMADTEQRDMRDYLGLHDDIAQQVYALTEQITANAGSPYDRARAIVSHLQNSYRYTLQPETPPGNQDFVSYFLLIGKEGYCTYFASAMAVMGRIAGLPTRYVEGYIATPTGGVAQVTSREAHAWCEVYFDGFGWVPFDATPPATQGGPRRGGDAAPQVPENTQLPELPGTDEQQMPENEDLSPDASPSPDPSGGEDDPMDDSPEGTPEPADDAPPDEQETPQPDAEPTPPPDEPGQTPTPPAPPQGGSPPDAEASGEAPPRTPPNLWWLLWVAAAAAACLAVWRAVTTRPERVASRHKKDSAKLLSWYRALLGLLDAAGMPLRTYETPAAYAARLSQAFPEETGLKAFAQAVTEVGYGRGDVGPDAVKAAEACYRAVWRRVPLGAKLRWARQRMLHGIGSVKQVP